MTPFATWRARLPASIGSWFARDLVRIASALVEAKRVSLRSVEDIKIESMVRDAKGKHEVAIEWGTGTGPLALRAVCGCGASGMCEHVVATLDTVRSQTELDEPAEPATPEFDLSWLPAPRIDARQSRARSVWPVFSSPDGNTLVATLILDSPRLRGATRDAASIVAMMDSTPVDDWDELDREIMRDEAVNEAFAGRTAQRALARALFRLARHPRLRFDDEPSLGRHPSELPEFSVDLRGLTLRAVRRGTGFLPAFEASDGARISPADAMLLDGPPAWVATRRSAYLIDGSFDAKKAIETARSANGTVEDGALTPRAIARVAPFLTAADRASLAIVDANSPSAELALGWSGGALVAAVTFIDRETGARVPFSALGAIAPQGSGYIRFPGEFAARLRTRMLDAGFVPRAADGFALHGTDRAANFVRDVLPTWDDLDRRLDPGLTDLARGIADLDISVSAQRAAGDADWFELKVDVFVGGGTALTQDELSTLLASSGRFADVRGRLVDVEKLRERNSMLVDLAERRRSGLAALLAMRDELHDAFGTVTLPPEVEAMREKLRDFQGIPIVDAPELQNGSLREYQQRGLDFLAYLSEFGFGGVLADQMGLGKSLATFVPVLTPSGWQRFGDLNVGDEVMNAQGGISKVTGVFPQGFLDAFRVYFSDGASTVCSDDHLWAVNSANRKFTGLPNKVLTLREIREKLHDAAGNARHYIPIAEAMQFGNDDPLPIEPYLLGALLGDGGLTQRNVMFTSADDELVETFQEMLPTGTELVHAGRYDYRLRQTDPLTRPAMLEFKSQLDELGLTGLGSHQKFVPTSYKIANQEHRLAMLQGLMDTDGHVRPDGHVEFDTTSDQLAQDVAFLVRSLGGIARTTYRERNGYTYKGEKRFGKPSYRVGLAMPPGLNPFRLARKANAYPGRPKYQPSRAIVKVEPIGSYDMMCIAVDSPDHLFVVQDFIVTHNTVQVLSYLLRRKQTEGPAPSLVIAPTSVTHTWESEIARFAPDLRVLRLSSGSERAMRYDDIPNADVVITSYALARLDAQQLSQLEFRTLILDEAQNAKNPSSQIARVVRSLKAQHRLALTGTPVENSLRDLWAIFAFVEPGLLGTETSFRRRFEIPISENDEKATNVLRSRLEPFLLRRTKEDVAPELPDRTEIALACELSPLQRRLYRGVAEAARRDVFALVEEQGIENATVHVLAALTRLRQICAHPGLLFEEHKEDPEASAKFESFLETVDEVLSGGSKLLVFSAFASMLRIMRSALDAKGIKYGYLDGSTKDKDRQGEVARFMSPDGPPLFLCSLKAGGVGLTLTAADYVILYDPWWNPAVEQQAIDRTHRIGQQKPVTAYRLVTTGTVEEKIRALAERKSSLSKNVIKADGALAKALTREDLEMLLADPQ
jgi:superfamily II DNA or RNA helicase